MPYYVHPKDLEITEDNRNEVSYRPDVDALHDRATAYAEASKSDRKVTFLISDTERENWRHRERCRFDSGEYLRVPFPTFLHSEHYAHLSVKTPGMVAYTPSEEHGCQDRQVTLKPGRYLEKFYASEFSREDIATYIGRCSAEHMALKIARTPEDIARIYRGDGPRSCMSPGPNVRCDGNVVRHPCEVYGDCDLGVAYFGELDAAKARCVVWPDKMAYGRLYGSTHILEALLKDAGYTQRDDFHGAKIRRIVKRKTDGTVLMPYVDWCTGAEVYDEDYLMLTPHGDIAVDSTDGYVCEHGEDEIEYNRCDYCGNSYNEEDEGDGTYCGRCVDHVSTCDHCERAIQDNNTDWHTVRGDSYCDTCFENAHTDCADANCSNRWIESEEFNAEEQTQRERRHCVDLCRDCAERYEYCHHCEESYDTADCPDAIVCPECQRPPRCKSTDDLLAYVFMVKDLPPDALAYRLRVTGVGIVGEPYCYVRDNGQPILTAQDRLRVTVGTYADCAAAKENLDSLYGTTNTYTIEPLAAVSYVAF